VSRARRSAKRCAADPGSMLNHRSFENLAYVGMAEGFFVYILANKPRGTLYVGVTNDLVRRVSEHKAKLVPGFTRKYGIDQLMYFEQYPSILEARARERTLKRWRRAWKIDLIKKLNPDWHDLSSKLLL
jgi:putative endonuclease